MAEARRKLLIIDDEEELREVLVALLEEADLDIALASNGLEGIERLRHEQFDAILSDEKMPKKSGLEVLKWMHENGVKTPFIMHTGYGQRDMMAEAQKLGAFAFIDKPWDERKLINTIKDALQTGRQLRN
jgi:DNA-binding NtrC family response regulator